VNTDFLSQADGAVMDALDVIILYEGARFLMEHRVKRFGSNNMLLPTRAEEQEWLDRFGSLVDVGVSGDTIRMILSHMARRQITCHLEPLSGSGSTRDSGRIGAPGIRATTAPSNAAEPLSRARRGGDKVYSRAAVQNDEEAMEYIADAYALDLD
jgi:hypothetical protein